MKRTDKVLTLVSSIIFFIIVPSCHQPNETNIPQYDPRNITRIDNHIEALPNIAVDSQGIFHVLYQGSKKYSDPRNIYYIHQLPDQSWGVPVMISDSTNFDSYTPKLVIDSKDNLYAIWMGATYIYYTMRDSDGFWAHPVIISSVNSDQQLLAIDHNDRLHAVWSNGGGAETNEIGQEIHHQVDMNTRQH